MSPFIKDNQRQRIHSIVDKLLEYAWWSQISTLEEYEKAIECNRDNADNFFNRGNVWLNQERFDLAHEDFDAAIQREDRNAKFYHAKGLAF